jgi:hypothetical protein
MPGEGMALLLWVKIAAVPAAVQVANLTKVSLWLAMLSAFPMSNPTISSRQGPVSDSRYIAGFETGH